MFFFCEFELPTGSSLSFSPISNRNIRNEVRETASGTINVNVYGQKSLWPAIRDVTIGLLNFKLKKRMEQSQQF